jgi:2-succinyl-6-hydroxy-2,4-cyclohexadiene-1-carboxylate synthase
MLVLLHGFAGTGRSWDAVAAELGGTPYLAPDLGAGSWPDVPDEPVTLVGYSMGGRIALHVALGAPQRVARLVLVSTTAGIEDDGERARRRDSDEALARRIEQGTITEFADDWMAQPLFAGTPPKAAARWLADLLRNEPGQLATQLRRFGAGVLEPVWHRLDELTMPADVVVGERDAKYRALAERLARELPGARLHVVPGAGHGLPREAPAAVAAVLTDH